jgi:hypothetical protein
MEARRMDGSDVVDSNTEDQGNDSLLKSRMPRREVLAGVAGLVAGILAEANMPTAEAAAPQNITTGTNVIADPVVISDTFTQAVPAVQITGSPGAGLMSTIDNSGASVGGFGLIGSDYNVFSVAPTATARTGGIWGASETGVGGTFSFGNVDADSVLSTVSAGILGLNLAPNQHDTWAQILTAAPTGTSSNFNAPSGGIVVEVPGRPAAFFDQPGGRGLLLNTPPAAVTGISQNQLGSFFQSNTMIGSVSSLSPVPNTVLSSVGPTGGFSYAPNGANAFQALSGTFAPAPLTVPTALRTSNTGTNGFAAYIDAQDIALEVYSSNSMAGVFLNSSNNVPTVSILDPPPDKPYFHPGTEKHGARRDAASIPPGTMGLYSQSSGIGGWFNGAQAPILLAPTTTTGHPTTGTHQQGEIVVDMKGNVFICTVAGTPGTWMEFQLGIPTAASVRTVRAVRSSDSITFRWRLASTAGVAGFDVYAGRRRLNKKLIPAHRSRDYRFTARSRARGRLMLWVILDDGGHEAIPAS